MIFFAGWMKQNYSFILYCIAVFIRNERVYISFWLAQFPCSCSTNRACIFELCKLLSVLIWTQYLNIEHSLMITGCPKLFSFQTYIHFRSLCPQFSTKRACWRYSHNNATVLSRACMVPPVCRQSVRHNLKLSGFKLTVKRLHFALFITWFPDLDVIWFADGCRS